MQKDINDISIYHDLSKTNQFYIRGIAKSMLAAQNSERERARKREEQLRRELSRPMTLK